MQFISETPLKKLIGSDIRVMKHEEAENAEKKNGADAGGLEKHTG